MVQPEGDCIAVTYDDEGHPTYAARMGAEQCALPPAQRDPAQMQSTGFTYEPRYGQIKTQSDALGATTVYTYDYELGLGDAGKLLQIAYPPQQDETGAWVTPVISYTYNILGLLAEETARDGAITRYVYTQGTPDEAYTGTHALFAQGVTPVPGLRTQIARLSGGTTLTTTYRDFDALGRALTTIAADGNLNRVLYDSMGRTISSTNTFGVTTLRNYDGAGRLRSSTLQRPGNVPVVTEYEYRCNGLSRGKTVL